MLKKLFFIVPIIVMIILLCLLLQPDIVKQSRFDNYLIVLTIVHVVSGIILIAYHVDGFDDNKDIFYYYALWWVYVFTSSLILLTNHFYPQVLNTIIIATIVKVSLFVVYAVHHYKLLQLLENFLNKMDAKIEKFYEFNKIKIEK